MRLVLACVFILFPLVASAEKRVSLIIGNNSYAEVPVLAKAVADAEAMAEKLASVGFETVLATDVSRRDMNRAISRFTNMLEPGDTAFVFYAGHGVEISGENYLLPTDIIAPSSGERDVVAAESIALSDLLDRVRRTGARTTLAVIDACRNNPFEAVTGRSVGRTRGLGRISAPEGTFVMFSAGAGQLALDGLNEADTNRNSVFTRLLLPKLDQPGLELRALIADLRVEVRDLARTQNHAQFPAYYDELLGDFYFKSGRGLEPVQMASAEGGTDTIRADFALAREMNDPTALEIFLETYGDREDFTVDLARKMLERMDGDGAEPIKRSGEPTKEVAALPEVPADDPAPAERTRRDIIRESQVQLRRLGCSPGGADGKLGPRSRAAFGRFLSQTGSSLSANTLGSEKALNTLKSTAAPACETTQVASAPVSDPVATVPDTASGLDISGTWKYSFFCIVVPGSGSVNIRRTGGNTFVGSFSDSLGQTGSFSIRMNGRNYVANITNSAGAKAVETGTYSADGRSYKSTSHSVGCSVKGSKVN